MDWTRYDLNVFWYIWGVQKSEKNVPGCQQVTRADYDWVRRLCSRHSMTAQEWDRRGFNDPNITHLYPTNNEVNLHNTQALNSLDMPILRIEAKNSNAMMRKLRPA